MTMFLAPYTAIADIDGSPLDAGFIYFGEFGKNPETHPIPVYWDADFAVPAAQPIRTRNGYPIRNGSPCKIYLKQAEHSLVVKNKNLSAILVEMNNKGISSSLLVRPDGNTVETSLVEIDAALDTKASSEYVDNQVGLMAPQATTYTKTEVDSALSLKAPQSSTYTKSEVDAAFAAYAGGRKAYTTLALAQADQVNLPVNTAVEVTNDGANNGTYQWNGTTLTKSAYDPLTQGKNYTESFLPGSATFTCQPSAVVYNSALKQLTVGVTTFSVSTAKESFLIASKTVDLPTTSGAYLLTYDRASATLAFKQNSDRLASDFVIGQLQYTLNATPIFTFDFAYTRDGEVIKPITSRTAIASNSLNSQVTINLTDKTISWAANVLRITAPNLNITLPATTLVLPDNNGSYSLDYDVATKLVTINAASAAKLDTSVTFATLRKTTGFAEMIGIPFYNINGLVPVGAEQGHLYTGTITSLNLDTVNKKLITANSGRVIYGSNFQWLPNATIDLPTANNTYRVELDLLTNTVQIVSSSQNQKPMTVCFARLKLNASGYTLYGVDTYSINGSAPPSFDTFTLESKPNYALAFTSPSTLNFNFIENKIEITGNIWIPYNGNRILITATTIDLDPLRNTLYRTIIAVNPNNSKIVLGSSNGYTMPKDHIVIGGYLEREMLFYGLKGFSVNGEVWSDAGKVKQVPSFGFSTNSEVNVDVDDSYKLTDTLPYNQIRSNTVYGWYDALVAAYPDYITKTTLGSDASGTLPIHQYRFSPKLPTSQSELVVHKIPKVMLITLHNEYMNFIYMHTLLREICENWASSEALTAMRYGVEFVVIPVGNPWGLDNNMRTNSNQVDVNRNFPQDWIPLYAPGDPAYSGTAALSEAEAQHIYAAMQSEKPDIFYDCHSFGAYKDAGEAVWVPIYNDATKTAVVSTLSKIYAQYKKEASFLADLDALGRLTYGPTTGGGICAKTANAMGMIGGTFETSWNMKGGGAEENGSNFTVNFTTDFFGTLILKSIEMIV